MTPVKAASPLLPTPVFPLWLTIVSLLQQMSVSTPANNGVPPAAYNSDSPANTSNSTAVNNGVSAEANDSVFNTIISDFENVVHLAL